MKNNICVVARGVNKKFLKNIYEHNVQRLQKGLEIDYLLKDEDSLGFNSKIVNNGNYESLNDYNQINEKLEELEKQRMEILSKRENNGDYLKNHLVEFVVVLSEEQSNFYLENGKKLNLGIEQFIEDLEQNYNIKSLMYSEHFDEGHIEDEEIKRNIHFHIVGYNYSIEEEKSILSNFTKQDFRDLQDLAQNSFQKVGLDFERGLSKRITKKEHLEKNDFTIQKQKDEIKFLEKRRKEEYYFAKEVKNDIKDLRANFERDSIEFEQLTALLNVARNEEKERSEKNRIEFESSKEQRSFISGNLRNILQKHLKNDEIGLIKKETITKVEDKNQLFKDLINEFERMSKIDIQNMDYNNTKNYEQTLIKEKNQLSKKNEELENKNETLKKQNEILQTQQDSFINNFKNFKEKYLELEEQNNTYKDFILQNNLQKKFENFEREIKEEDNNLQFNF
ncbi:hypothetical protein [Aliarcobacter butzleri]|uniref:hypothetical protein n=1 Tax=Aliarcobacter butzleri TaxID=28197 RepID=UPI0021B6950E|nr:hypothetical protein [Aliarcobacter butzleri]MCT7588225.1 hypothetical protein [Aliarcobacter butzleri]